MLEQLLIFTRGGLVLWTWRALGNALKGSPIDALICSCLLEEGSGDATYQYVAAGAAYTLKWVFDNELGLVIVAVYEQILHLLYVDELLARVKCEFARIYNPKRTSYADFDNTFRQLLKEAETRAEDINNMKQQEKPVEVLVKKRGQTANQRAGSQCNKEKSSSKSESKADAGEEDAHTMGAKLPPLSNGLTSGTKNANSQIHTQPPSENINNKDIGAPKLTEVASDVNKLHNLRARPTKKSRSASKPLNEVQRKKKAKKSQVWDDAPQHSKLDVTDLVSDRGVENVAVLSGQEKKNNMMDKDEHISSQSGEIKEGDIQKSSNLKNRWFSSIFQSVAGKAALGRSDLDLPLKALKGRLMMKNVAEEIAEKVCESVATSLEGRRLGSVTQISSTVQAAMEEALLHILIPKHSVDILSDAHAAREKSRPYIVVFVGVNGVGKAADLAKVAYWLLQHDLHVMMASCDTVRSGAVEQLRTHAERLQIPLFEKGYEREPAIVAKEAIEEANHNNSDVVLVDIAGGMQDNEPLMRALSKLINLNQPDLVLFVGEALVSNDAIDHLMKSNKKLAELGNRRLIDGILLTKFDATDDKVGAALSMVYALGAPVMFVGCGQSYADLQKFNVRSIVKVLLK